MDHRVRDVRRHVLDGREPVQLPQAEADHRREHRGVRFQDGQRSRDAVQSQDELHHRGRWGRCAWGASVDALRDRSRAYRGVVRRDADAQRWDGEPELRGLAAVRRR